MYEPKLIVNNIEYTPSINDTIILIILVGNA